MRRLHAAATDVGRVREHNEDNVLADPELGFYAVADGMGGRAAGEVASKLAVETMAETLRAHRGDLGGRDAGSVLTAAVHAASRAILCEARKDSERQGMGTTVTAVLTQGERVHVAHVGDSRLYLVRGGEAVRLTRDHTLLEELVLAGHVSRADADGAEMGRLRNVLARAVGVAADIVVDTFEFRPLPGDRLLLCSDGLSHYVDEPEIAEVAGGDPEVAVVRLVQVANERGGHDNSSAVVLGFEDGDDADLTAAERYGERFAALSAIPALRDLEPRLATQVILASETSEYPAGTEIARADTPADALCVLLQGTVRFRHGAEAERAAGPGCWFGEAVLVDRWVRTPRVVAASRVRVARLSRDAVDRVSAREPELPGRLVQAFAKGLAERTGAARSS
ncbi:MAG: hypothetical protein HMLKMBBP_03911 [Planctomycetes bacterium]|nr:hypothetical protein [Planctomycetota bacterium]